MHFVYFAHCVSYLTTSLFGPTQTRLIAWTLFNLQFAFLNVSSLSFSDIRLNTTYYMIVHLHGMNWKDGKSKNITRNEGSSERILLDVIFDKMTFSLILCSMDVCVFVCICVYLFAFVCICLYLCVL